VIRNFQFPFFAAEHLYEVGSFSVQPLVWTEVENGELRWAVAGIQKKSEPL
jgi:hypothetical protein